MAGGGEARKKRKVYFEVKGGKVGMPETPRAGRRGRGTKLTSQPSSKKDKK